MARKLNTKQRNAVECLAAEGVKSFSFLKDKQEEEKIASLGWYETVYQDMERYLGDCRAKIIQDSEPSLYRGLQF